MLVQQIAQWLSVSFSWSHRLLVRVHRARFQLKLFMQRLGGGDRIVALSLARKNFS